MLFPISHPFQFIELFHNLKFPPRISPSGFEKRKFLLVSIGNTILPTRRGKNKPWKQQPRLPFRNESIDVAMKDRSDSSDTGAERTIIHEDTALILMTGPRSRQD